MCMCIFNQAALLRWALGDQQLKAVCMEVYRERKLEKWGRSTRTLAISLWPHWRAAQCPCLVLSLSPQSLGSCWNRLGTGCAGANGTTQKRHSHITKLWNTLSKSVSSLKWGQLCYGEKQAGLGEQGRDLPLFSLAEARGLQSNGEWPCSCWLFLRKPSSGRGPYPCCRSGSGGPGLLQASRRYPKKHCPSHRAWLSEAAVGKQTWRKAWQFM